MRLPGDREHGEGCGWTGRGEGRQGGTETLLVVVGVFSILIVGVVQRVYIYDKVTKLYTFNTGSLSYANYNLFSKMSNTEKQASDMWPFASVICQVRMQSL